MRSGRGFGTGLETAPRPHARDTDRHAEQEMSVHDVSPCCITLSGTVYRGRLYHKYTSNAIATPPTEIPPHAGSFDPASPAVSEPMPYARAEIVAPAADAA
jgi:hypothetical protein